MINIMKPTYKFYKPLRCVVTDENICDLKPKLPRIIGIFGGHSRQKRKENGQAQVTCLI